MDGQACNFTGSSHHFHRWILGRCAAWQEFYHHRCLTLKASLGTFISFCPDKCLSGWVLFPFPLLVLANPNMALILTSVIDANPKHISLFGGERWGPCVVWQWALQDGSFWGSKVPFALFTVRVWKHKVTKQYNCTSIDACGTHWTCNSLHTDSSRNVPILGVDITES